LGIGEHEFEFEIDDRFFEKYDHSDIQKGAIDIKLLLEKQDRMLILNFDIRGRVNVICDRCLEYYDQRVNGLEKLIVKFGDKFSEESDEVIVIPESEHKIDIGHYIYEYISLLLPIKQVHANDEEGVSRCNKEVAYRMENHEEDKKTDPRWEVLKTLQKNMNNK